MNIDNYILPLFISINIQFTVQNNGRQFISNNKLQQTLITITTIATNCLYIAHATYQKESLCKIICKMWSRILFGKQTKTNRWCKTCKYPVTYQVTRILHPKYSYIKLTILSVGHCSHIKPAVPALYKAAVPSHTLL